MCPFSKIAKKGKSLHPILQGCECVARPPPTVTPVILVASVFKVDASVQVGHFFHIILCSFSYSETLRTGREGSLCTTLGYHKKFPPDSKGINEGKGQCNGIITPTFCKTKLNHHGHSFLFFYSFSEGMFLSYLIAPFKTTPEVRIKNSSAPTSVIKNSAVSITRSRHATM